MQLHCYICKKPIDRQPSQVRYHKRHVCSIQCRNKLPALNKGKTNGNWKGGKIMLNGYIAIRTYNHPSNKNYVFEHRLVMEKKLGRSLTPQEVVHHINGIMTDNRIKNLMLTKKASHHSLHNKNQTYYKQRTRNKLGQFR